MGEACSKQKANPTCSQRKSSLGRARYRWKSYMKRSNWPCRQLCCIGCPQKSETGWCADV